MTWGDTKLNQVSRLPPGLLEVEKRSNLKACSGKRKLSEQTSHTCAVGDGVQKSESQKVSNWSLRRGREADRDGDGLISPEEFYRVMRKCDTRGCTV